MSLKLFIFVFLPAFTFGQSALQPYNTTASVMFAAVDGNVDGYIDIRELNQSFVQYDTNGDNRVTRNEYTNYINEHSPTLHSLSHALYDIYDVDGDHNLDHHDYDNFFRLMDGNDDGLISKDEYVRYWSILFTDLEHLHG
ncbi:uncharacterized protein LOC131945964 [Physella acuta]|uniref:uncharacterized protein LOC131945964 n=1 Tax=Physella acuta TaxID=109671 RepID=UPI0027DCBC3C|nr:uncharacterized protein LOC131945964 [Physella acuta]